MTNTLDTNNTATTIDTARLRELIDHGPAVGLVDVRTSGEFDGAHIHGSHNVPLDVLDGCSRQLAAIERPLVLICRSGARATQARTTLAAAGAQQVLVLDGGVDAWQATGGDVDAHSQTEKWALDRQIRLVAGSLVLTGVLGSLIAPRAKWLAGAIGGGLTFSAVSNTCAMGNMLARLPYNQSTNNDTAAAIEALQAGRQNS